MNARRGPTVFLGPSASRDEIAAVLPGADIRPPIRRGDLYAAREQGGVAFLVIDGMFNQDLAVSPREVIEVARDGALVCGASSMGALRAAECWPVGVRPLGVIARMYKLGWLDSDDEVAVAIDPDRDFACISVPLINVRYAVSKAVRRRLVDRRRGHALVDAARALYFAERRWSTILKMAEIADDGSLERFLRGFDLKRQDAINAARTLAADIEQTPHPSERHSPQLGVRERYPGHDRYLGERREDALAGLTRWLFATGRYQPYIWALVAGEPELHVVTDDGAERPAQRREALAQILSRRLQAMPALADDVCRELEFLEELDAELTQAYAVRVLSDGSSGADPSTLARVRDEIAIAHGFVDWDMLRDEVVDGLLWGAIPFAWIADACERIARARTSCA
jgi:hypothetical protein